MLPSFQDRIFLHIEDHLSSYLLRPLLADEHPADTAPAQHGQTKEQELVAHLHTLGFASRVFGNDQSLIYAERAPDDREGRPYATLLLYHRYDPLASQHRSGVSSGLENIAACLAALAAYQQTMGSLPINIKWLLDGASRVEHSELAAFVEEHAGLLQADACLWGNGDIARDGVPILAPGSKGLLCVELTAHTAKQMLSSEYGSIAPNAAWRLIWALGSIKDAREEVLIEGFYDTLASFEDSEIELLHALPDDAQHLAQSWGMEQLLFGLKGFQLHYTRYLIPSCTINEISSGFIGSGLQLQREIPAQARAMLDFHLVPGQDPEDIFHKLQWHLSEQGFGDIQVRKVYTSRPAHTPLADPFVQLVRRAAASACGREPYIIPISSGSDPLYIVREGLRLPIVSIGIASPGASMPVRDEQQRKHVFATHSKHLAMIFGEISDATRTTE